MAQSFKITDKYVKALQGDYLKERVVVTTSTPGLSYEGVVVGVDHAGIKLAEAVEFTAGQPSDRAAGTVRVLFPGAAIQNPDERVDIGE